MTTAFEDNQLFRFEEIAFDVGLIFGSTTDQGLTRARRCLNRAMIDIAGHDRKWSWLRTKDSFLTVSGTREYSLNQDVRVLENRMWMEGDTRGTIRRIPTAQFLESVPNPDDATGNPCFFDEEGVDSSGCKVVSVYPVPASALEIFYRYSRHIQPILDGQKDVRAYWGLPQNLLLALTNKAASMTLFGVNSKRAQELGDVSEMQVLEAYAADQAKPYTDYRAPMQEGESNMETWPMWPPTIGG